jgi:5-methyltetrahydrofolate--homocysteine methyltransferase
MQYVAAEMQKDDYFRIKKIPLLIGGATTARAHRRQDRAALRRPGGLCARRLAQRGRGANLLGDNAASFVAELQADYDKVRSQHANKKQTPLWTLAKARANKTAIDWAPTARGARSWAAACSRTRPGRAGRTSTGARSSRPGTWRALPGHPRRRGRGREARKVFADGQAMLKKIIEAAGCRPTRAACARQQRGRRHRVLHRRRAARSP